ncbi:MAG: protein kinase [Bryobacteraceae bacterium]
MNQTRRRQVNEILLGALEREGAARRAFLDEQCSDDAELRKEVEELLAAATRTDDFLEEPLFHVSEIVAPAGMTGKRIGAYRVVQLIGHGGMGAVYLAEREDGEFTRQAAMKIIRPGLDSEELLRGFRRERQILASLAHPNIAMLLDGGTMDDGAPYFVMEYIKGQPVDEWMAAHQLPLRARVELFLTVCSAVDHAHRNLVVHGDIKPGNILVTEDGMPKLLDFGIARPAGGDEEGASVAVTPKYASPEQLRGEPINTLSDVYALGVLLRDFVGPEGNEELMGIAAKASRAEPGERYLSVDALRADMVRFLEGKPVSVCASGPWYRTCKFVRRHPWPVAFAALLLVGLLATVVNSRIQNNALRAERDRANRHFEEVRALATSLIFEIEQDAAQLAGSTAMREKLVTRALTYLDILARESTGNATLQSDLADAYERLGDVQGRSGSSNLGQTDRARASYRKALVLRQELASLDPENAKLKLRLATAYSRQAAVLQDMGDFQKGLAYERQALAIREALLAAEPTAEHERAVAQNYSLLGAGLAQSGDWDGALSARQRALDLYKRIVARDPNNRSDQRGFALAERRLGGILLRNKDLAGAEQHYREALRIESGLAAKYPGDLQIRTSLASAHAALGGVLYESGKYAAALGSYRNAQRIQEEIAATDAHDVRSASLLSNTLQRMSEALLKGGDAQQAWVLAERCLQIRRKVAAASPANAGARGDVATAMATMGLVAAAKGDRALARQWYGAAMQVFQELEVRGQASANLKEEARHAREAMTRLEQGKR